MAQAAEVQGASLNALIEETLERTFGTFKPKGRIGSANKPRPVQQRNALPNPAGQLCRNR